MTIVQEVKSDLFTSDLARQAIQAKKHEHRADSLAQNRKLKEAAEEYKHAHPDSTYEDEILYVSLGGALSEMREYTEALQYLETASSINPLNEDVARNLEICGMNAGKR
jgi:tetratricopeptide (TPR) repeat protein